jgi:AcrR family transcriptional regulator
LDEGLAGFSLRKVAAACELSAPAVYRHFEDRNDLLAAAIKQSAELFTSHLLAALAASTPMARMRALGERYYDFAVSHRRDYELMFVLNCAILGLDSVKDKSREENGASFRLLVDRVAECQRSGDLHAGDPEQLALSIWSCVHGLVSLALSGRIELEGHSLRELFLFHLDTHLRGLAG